MNEDISKREYDNSTIRTQLALDNVEEFVCKNCGIIGDENIEMGPAFWTCINCGLCYGQVISEEYLPWQCVRRTSDNNGWSAPVSTLKRDRDGRVIKPFASSGCDPDRRYVSTMHYKERLAQWQCKEPEILDASVIPRFQEALRSGKYGTRKECHRGTVMWMCRELKLCKYKECWKTILWDITKKSLTLPPDSLVEDCLRTFKMLLKRFNANVQDTAFPLRGARGKPRHNVMHLNYTHRKILEGLGHWEYHREFPLLRTPSKIHALDDAMEPIAREIGLPFVRTPVVVIPRCKVKTKSRQNLQKLENEIYAIMESL